LTGTALAAQITMRPRKPEATAVFHGREAMEEAVHDLVDRGVRPTSIRISQGTIDEAAEVRTAPEGGDVLPFGLVVGALAGAALAFTWMYLLRGMVDVPLGYVVLRMLGGASSGALLGALVALLLLAAHAMIRDDDAAKTGDFVVRVKSPSEGAARRVRYVLDLHGGEALY
jgi:hypothetical protein